MTEAMDIIGHKPFEWIEERRPTKMHGTFTHLECKSFDKVRYWSGSKSSNPILIKNL
jgi:hypothetical protein